MKCKSIPTLLAGLRLRAVHSFAPFGVLGGVDVARTGRRGDAVPNSQRPSLPPSAPFVAAIRGQNAAQAALPMTSPAPSGGSFAEYPLSSGGEALQGLFARHCDGEGLLSEKGLRDIPAIREMLDEGDLLSSELEEIWKAAPKFPSVEDKIDIDSFIQVYRDIDDLFEDDGNAEEEKSIVEEAAVGVHAALNVGFESVDDKEEYDGELGRAFTTLTDGTETIQFSQLRQWEEISSLIDDDRMLSEEEIVMLWEKTLGAKGTAGDMDLAGFVTFNSVLDELFEFEDEETGEEGEDGTEEEDQLTAVAPLPLISEEDLPPGEFIDSLARMGCRLTIALSSSLF
ncbi:hypothetical protein ACHAWF_002308 [Thalassiosira exigua]